MTLNAQERAAVEAATKREAIHGPYPYPYQKILLLLDREDFGDPGAATHFACGHLSGFRAGFRAGLETAAKYACDYCEKGWAYFPDAHEPTKAGLHRDPSSLLDDADWEDCACPEIRALLAQEDEHGS